MPSSQKKILFANARKYYLFIGCWLLGCFGLKVWLYFQLKGFPCHSQLILDAKEYHEWGFLFAQRGGELPNEVFHQSPFYSIFVGIVYMLFGSKVEYVVFIQIFLGLGTIFLTAEIAKLIMGTWAGVVSALVVGLYGPLIFYEAQILPTTLSTFLCTLFLFFAIFQIKKSKSSLYWLFVGFVYGLCVLARPNTLLLILPLSLIFIFSKSIPNFKERVIGFSLLCIAALITIAPCTIHNFRQSGDFIPITDSGGLNFYIGNYAGATGIFKAPSQFKTAYGPREQFKQYRAYAEAKLKRTLSHREFDRFWFRQTFADIQKAPISWIKLLWRKLNLFFSPREIINVVDYEFISQHKIPIYRYLLSFKWIGSMTILGIFLCFFYKNDERYLIASSFIIYCFSIVLFFVVGRYRIPIVPVAILLSVFFVERVLKLIKEQNSKQTVMVLLSLVFLSVGTFNIKSKVNFSRSYAHAAHCMANKGDLLEAIENYQKALQHRPNSVLLMGYLHFCYTKVGLYDKAAELKKIQEQRLLESSKQKGRKE